MKSIERFIEPLYRNVLMTILFLFTFTQITTAQISLSLKNATLGQVINILRAQTKYQFFYDDKLSEVHLGVVNVKDVNIHFLDQILKDKNITYKVEDNIVYLSTSKLPLSSLAPLVLPSITVSGVVTDKSGVPLIGVSVAVKGTTEGTMTDIKGRYVIKTEKLDGSLVFSCIGYKQQMWRLTSLQNRHIIMIEDEQLVDEIVVTALGIKREKKMLGYAIQEIKSDQFNQTADPSLTSLIQGKVAGLQMNISNTGLSGSTKITLRGNSSLVDNNQPLWVVDGVPFNDSNVSDASLFGGVDRGNTSIDINPNDIESISVLKGPNASALYGSRAGNGVILITTKKGTKQVGFGVSYNTSITWANVAETLYMQDKYGQGTNGVFTPSSEYSFGELLTGNDYTAWNGITQKYQKSGNKMKDYFGTGFSQTHNLAIGCVTEKTNYRVSIGTSESKGLFPGEGLSKLNIDLKAGTEVNRYLSLDSKVSLSKTKVTNRPVYGKGGEIYQLLFIPNNIQLIDLKNYSDNTHRHLNWFGPRLDVLNPYYINNQYSNMDERWRAFGYYSANLTFTPWFTFTGKYSFDYYSTEVANQNRTNGIDNSNTDSMQDTKEKLFEQNIELMMCGNNSITDRLKVYYTVGANRMNRKTDFLLGKASNMKYKNTWYLNSALGFNAAEQGITERETRSVFGSGQFAWNEYVSLDVTARNDWSSTLPINNRSYFYESSNVSFIVSDYMQKMNWYKPLWLTFAKVRFSAAKVGNDTDPYQLNEYSIYTRKEGSDPNRIDPNVKANPNLKPEISHAYEAGLDMKFLDNRFGFDFTYYQSSTINQIMTVPMSGEYFWKRINAGNIQNRGFELVIYSIPLKTKNSAFYLNVNLAHNNTLVKELTPDAKYMSLNYKNESMLIDVGAEEGQRLGNIYANASYVTDANGNIKTRNGLPLIIRQRSRNPIGNIQPDLLMSVSPSFVYKGFDISALFDMKFGGDIVSISEAIATGYGTAKRTENRENMIFNGVDEITEQPNTIAVSGENLFKMIGGGNAVASEFLYSASYIKLKELSVGYSVPSKWLQHYYLNSLRFSLIGRNLFYLLKKTPGTSPEGGFDSNMFSQAIDFTSVPYTRTIGFSVSVSF